MSIVASEATEQLPTPEQVAAMVRSLAAVMDERAVTELDVSFGSLSLRLRRPPHAREQAHASASPAPRMEEVAAARSHLVTAPMVGTFYSAPTPGSQPFVNIGDSIVIGQTIGIIEAMKIMNEITADRSGVVLELLIGNGQPVEYGSPLLRLALADA